MKISLFITLLFNTFIMMSQQSVHEFTINTIDGESKNLSDFKGKKMLFVNTASQCGFTPQYMELQELHEKHGDELVIIGFPANNFGGQEPGSNDQIKTFCQKNYGVSFMLSEKVSVKGKNIDPIFKWLNAQDNQSFKGDIMWNFEKYLIDESGKLIKRYRSMTKPDSDKIISLI
ncbi:MAG: glutathione peroxidase [Bacteroidota bacterium]|mgnify:FL=1|nr:glutathione peroxidase [Bacteroidota bacterium]